LRMNFGSMSVQYRQELPTRETCAARSAKPRRVITQFAITRGTA
jgi:hypothetical protein